LRDGAALARAGERVSVALELRQGELALLERLLRLRNGLVRDLETAGVAIALGRQLVDRLVELLAGAARAPVGAADRRLEPIAQGAIVPGQVAQLEVVHRRGRAEEAFGRDPG